MAEKKKSAAKPAAVSAQKVAKKAEKAPKNAPLSHGVGRRKKSVARVWLRRGTGNMSVNGVEYTKYFDTDMTRSIAKSPLKAVSVGDNYDVAVNVVGGGKQGQADAVKLGIARAMVAIDEGIRSALRQYGFLTVDARVKERKKYGQRGARRKFQFVKR
ncbi:MAG TPA: 30S ribosomal protein S9 [Candidatus Dependentiae bacterium]|nr:30S ribosomal protein S9 [Candidatus Dependentiae bacterium]HRQ62645.1 30S ribosomal protein S9 [Candidatus Dependentiae bacterium]